MAEKLDVSCQAVSRWETGVVLPDANNILALSKIHNITTDYLLCDDYTSDEDLPKVKENNTILHSNLICNVRFVEQHYESDGDLRPESGSILYYVAPVEHTEFLIIQSHLFT